MYIITKKCRINIIMDTMVKENNYQEINNQIIYELLNNKYLTSQFISGIAGDRILTDEEKKIYKKVIKEAGDELYIKILFFITHHTFQKSEAKKLWEEILKHKYEMSEAVHRNVEIIVATLDYLTHIKKKIHNPKLIGESFIGKLVELSSIDDLTKLYNRAYFFEKIKEELKRYRRYKTPFSLIMLDIDDFKRVNDLFGHLKGDEVLSEFGQILLNSRRDLDICARYGGEEFAIILPHTNGEEAKIISERIREKVKYVFRKEIKITVSIGISNCPKSGMTLKSLIKKADDALYESKRMGKNIVTSK